MRSQTGWSIVLIGLAVCASSPGQSTEPGASEPTPSTLSPSDSDTTAPLTPAQTLDQAEASILLAEGGGSNIQSAFADANRWVNSVLAADPANARAGYLHARVLILGGRPSEAMKAIQKWTQSPGGQNDWNAFKLLGDLYRQGSYHTLAVEKYRMAARLNPNEPSVQVGLALAYTALGQRQKAVQAARDAVNSDLSNDPSIRSHLVTALLEAERLTEARREADKVVSRTRAILAATLTDATLVVELDRRIEVLMTIIRDQLIADPKQPDEYVRIAELSLDRASLAHQLAYHQALGQINVGIAAVGGDTPPSLRYARAQLLSVMGERSEAIAELEVLLQTDPENAKARELLLRLESEAAAEGEAQAP